MWVAISERGALGMVNFARCKCSFSRADQFKSNLELRQNEREASSVESRLVLVENVNWPHLPVNARLRLLHSILPALQRPRSLERGGP